MANTDHPACALTRMAQATMAQAVNRIDRALQLAVMLVASGCGSLDVVVPLPAHSFGPDIDSNAFEGEIRYEEGCLYLAGDGSDLNILWPVGYTLKSGPPALVVRDDGTAIAAAGDQVEIGGLPSPHESAVPRCPPRRGILLGIIASVNGERLAPAWTPPPPPQPRQTERPKPR